jgi:hypothetical protein
MLSAVSHLDHPQRPLGEPHPWEPHPFRPPTFGADQPSPADFQAANGLVRPEDFPNTEWGRRDYYQAVRNAAWTTVAMRHRQAAAISGEAERAATDAAQRLAQAHFLLLRGR